MNNINIKITAKKNIMGRPPAPWLLDMYLNKKILDNQLYKREDLSIIFEKHPMTIRDVIEKAYFKLYNEDFPYIKEMNEKNIIIKYQGNILRKLSKEYFDFIFEIKKNKKR